MYTNLTPGNCVFLCLVLLDPSLLISLCAEGGIAGKVLHQGLPGGLVFQAVHAQPCEPGPEGVFLVLIIHFLRLNAFLLLTSV